MATLVPQVYHKTITSGDDYLAADGRELKWEKLTNVPSLVNAVIELKVGYDANNIYGSNLPITYKNEKNTEATTATVSLTHVQSEELLEGCYDYILRATLTDKSVVTVATGKFTVLAPPGVAPLQPL